MKESKGNTVEIEISSPILRPGVVLRTRVSQAYAPSATEQLLKIAREVNDRTGKPDENS